MLAYTGFALLALSGAVLLVTAKDALQGAAWLILAVLGAAGILMLAGADTAAVAVVMAYGGAAGFFMRWLGQEADGLEDGAGRMVLARQKRLGLIVAALVLVQLAAPLLQSGWAEQSAPAAGPVRPGALSAAAMLVFAIAGLGVVGAVFAARAALQPPQSAPRATGLSHMLRDKVALRQSRLTRLMQGARRNQNEKQELLQAGLTAPAKRPPSGPVPTLTQALMQRLRQRLSPKFGQGRR